MVDRSVYSPSTDVTVVIGFPALQAGHSLKLAKRLIYLNSVLYSIGHIRYLNLSNILVD